MFRGNKYPSTRLKISKETYISLPYCNIRRGELLRTHSQRDIYVSYDNIYIKNLDNKNKRVNFALAHYKIVE